MGKANMGNMVDMGPSAYDYFYSMDSIYCIPDASLCHREQFQKGKIRRHLWDNRLYRHAPCLSLCKAHAWDITSSFWWSRWWDFTLNDDYTCGVPYHVYASIHSAS